VTERTENAVLAERIARDLNAIRRVLRKPLEAELVKNQLTVPQVTVLTIVARQPGITLKELSHEVNLAHSTVSGIVDRLEKRELVERRADSADGRVSRIYPSEQVTGFIRDRVPVLGAGPLEAALRRAMRVERVAISRALEKLRSLLEDE
jgi:DNA-binding MarR family transcriptional regulator